MMKKLLAFWNEYKLAIITALVTLLLCVGLVVVCVIFWNGESVDFDTVQYNTYTVQRNLGMRW
jgi:uncharacterized membrane protein YwzB